MTAYEKRLQERTAERVRIAKSGGDVKAYLRDQRNATLTGLAKQETKGKDYQTAHSAAAARTTTGSGGIQHPELDKAMGNAPEFVTTQSDDFVAPSSNEEEEKAGFGNLLFRSLIGGAASALGSATNDVGYRSQMTQPAQAAENAYWKSVADGTGGVQLNNEQDELALFMGVPTTGAQKAYEETYKTESSKPIDLKRAVDWGDAYNAETQRRYADAGFGKQLAADVASGVGGMLPSMAVRNIPVVGKFLSDAMLFSQASGKAIDEALADGASNEGALNYGAAVGAAELGSEKLFGGMAKLLGKGVADDVIATLATKIAKSPKGQKAVEILLNSLGEGVEEDVVYGITPALKSLYNNKSVWENLGDLDAGEAFYNLLVGSLTGLAFEGSSAIAMRGKGDTQTTEQQEQTTTEEAPEPDNVVPAEEAPPAEPGQQNSYTPGSRNHANAIMADQQMLEQFAKDAKLDLNALRSMPKAELRKVILNHYRGNQQTTEGQEEAAAPTQEGNTPLTDAILGEQPTEQSAEEGADQADVLGQLQAGDKLIDENGNVVAEIKNVTPYGITYIDSEGYDDMVPFNNPDGESIYETLGASNGHFERPDGTWVGKNPKPAQNTPIADAILGEQSQTAAQQTAAQPSPAITGERQVLPPVVEETEQQTVPNGTQYHPINEAAQQVTQESRGRGPVHIPTVNGQGRFTSKTVSTLANANITTNEVAAALERDIAAGKFSRIPITDAAAVATANETIEKLGWDGALENYRQAVHEGRHSKDITALGAVLFNNAVNSPGGVVAAMDVASLLIENQRSSAQATQAASIINKLSPEGRMYLLAKSIENIQQGLVSRFADKAPNIKVDPTLLNLYRDALQSGDEAAQADAMDQIYRNIAPQIPSTFKERFNAWRYLAMLGNPRTILKNFTANVVSAVVRVPKTLIATGLESRYMPEGTERYKAVINPLNASDKALLQTAAMDFANVEEAIMSGGKWQEGVKSGVEQYRTIMRNKWLEKTRSFVDAAMEIGDSVVAKPEYIQALSMYLKANGFTAADFTNGNMSEAQISRAREVAMEASAKAVYRNTSALAESLSRLSRGARKLSQEDGTLGALGKAANIAIEGVLPFKKTPANVLTSAFEYSPLGLANGVFKMAKSIKNDGVNAADAIDSIAAGLTGTGIMMLGMYLRSIGMLSGGRDDDDKQEAFNQLQGKQHHALTIGNNSYTIDWLASNSTFLFVGAKLHDAMQKDGLTFSESLKSLMSLTDPIVENSMLSGLEDLLETGKYGDAGLEDYLVSAATGYISQYIPTIFGQIERSAGALLGLADPNGESPLLSGFEKGRQETYRYNEEHMGVLDSSGQRFVGQLLNKLPGEYNQIDYVDAWGRTQDYSNPLLNALNQFVNPSYVSEEKTTEVEAELQALYDAGYTNVFPARRKQSDKVSVRDADGNIIVERYLTADEYEKFNRTQGQTALKLVSELMDSEAYAGMSGDQKSEAIDNIYKYAEAVALKQVEPTTKLTGMAKKAYEASNAGIDFTTWYKAYSEWKRISDTDREGYSGVDKATDFSRWVDTAGFTKEQADTLKGQLTFSSGFTADPAKYNDLTGAGISADVSDQIYDTVSALKPVNGKSTVQAWQKYEAIANSGATEAEIDKALKVYMGDDNNDYLKYEVMKAGGYSAKDFAIAFHYSKTALDKNSFITLVGAQDVDNADKLWDLMKANKNKLNAWKW